jgi:hypothetical protein
MVRLNPLPADAAPESQFTLRDFALLRISRWTKGTFAEGCESQVFAWTASRLGESELELIARISVGNLEGVEDAIGKVMEDQRKRIA